MKTAVLLMAYGGPGSLEDVEPYLLDVRGGRQTSDELVAEIRARYAHIGGLSPLLDITRQQAGALETVLNSSSAGDYKVFVGMRHWHPYINDTVREIHAAGFKRLVALCMTPFASRMSTGAYAEKLNDALRAVDPAGSIDVKVVEYWFDNPRYISAIAGLVRSGVAKFPPEVQSCVPVLFTAHSLPAAIINQGDPYDAQYRRSAAAIAAAAGLADDRWQVGYQSAGATNGRWLGPSLEEMLEALARKGEQFALAAPVGFVSDHVEILYDIDVEARETAARLGIHLERIDAPNISPPFIAALADIVLSAVGHNGNTNTSR